MKVGSKKRQSYNPRWFGAEVPKVTKTKQKKTKVKIMGDKKKRDPY